jgi:hypothetical protein
MRKTFAGTVLVVLMSVGSPAAAQVTPHERQRLVAHLEMTSSWLVDELARLSPAQLSFRRAPGSWTILEVLDHLLVVAPIYWQDLQNAVKAASPRRTTQTDADVLWYGIDRTSREAALPAETPKGLSDLRTGLETYRRLHTRLLQYVRTTQDDLRGAFVDRQRCDAYQWALLISTHEQRHVLQIREIKADRKFPAK